MRFLFVITLIVLWVSLVVMGGWDSNHITSFLMGMCIGMVAVA